MFTFGGYYWNVIARDGTLVLAKAGKKKGAAVEGQLSLFDEQAHPRDESGRFTSKGDAVSHVKSHIPGELEKLKTSAAQLHSRIKTMSYDELDDYDPDGDFWDNHAHASIQRLGEKIKDHPDADEIMDEDEHFEDIYNFYNETSERLSNALSQRQEEISNHASEIHSETSDALDEELTEIIESIDEDTMTFQDWQATKQKLSAAYDKRLKEGYQKLKAIGASRSDFDDLTEELRGQLDDALDQYSSDPEDWLNDE